MKIAHKLFNRHVFCEFKNLFVPAVPVRNESVNLSNGLNLKRSLKDEKTLFFYT